MKTFKGTKGEWFLNYIGPIPIGVNAKIIENELGTYSKNIVETILPNDDGAWKKEKEETTANLKLISASPLLLMELQAARKDLIEVGFNKKSHRITSIDKAINKAI